MERDKYMASFPEILIEIPVRMRATMDGWLYGWMDAWTNPRFPLQHCPFPLTQITISDSSIINDPNGGCSCGGGR